MHAAVVNFQRSLRLRPDGVIGPQTWAKLVVTGESARVSASRSAASTAAPATAKQAESVADLSFSQRFEKVLKLVPSHLTPELAAQFRAMLNPTTIAFAGSTFGALAGAQFFGVGEVVDAFLFGVGVATLGAGAFEGGKAIGDCLMATLEAKDPSDLDKAAADFAKGVVLLGITTIFALLMNPRAKSGAGPASEEAAASPAAAEGSAPAPAPKAPKPKLAEEPPKVATGSSTAEPGSPKTAKPSPWVDPNTVPVPKRLPEQLDKELTQKLLNAKPGSPEETAAAEELAKRFTRSSPKSDRVVLGKWKNDFGGYIGEAEGNGGTYYQSYDGFFGDIGRDDAKAWKVNEAFLRQQVDSGKPFEFTEDPVRTALSKPDSYATKEFDYLRKNGFESDDGYVFGKRSQ